MSLSSSKSVSASDWARHVENQKKSGLNQKAYCKQHDLVYHRFKYWCYRGEAVAKKTKLIPIKLAENNTTTVLASIELSNGQRLLIHSAQLVKQLLQGGV